MNRASGLLTLGIRFGRHSLLLGCLVAAGLSNRVALAQSSGTFIPTGNLTTPRYFHTATLLNDGRVLIAGGAAAGRGVIASAELYDPTTGTFSLTGSMANGRSSHNATLLPDGRVLITGGFNSSYNPVDSAELYDPVTGTFTTTGSSMNVDGNSQAATLLSTGKVLISSTSGFGLYDPDTGTVMPTGTDVTAEGYAATRLLSGNVLLRGYHFGPDAVLYYPATGTDRALTFPDLLRVYSYTTTLLPDGKVLLAGGTSGGYAFTAYCCAYLYNPTSETFQRTGSLLMPRGFHTATLLPSGKVLFAGGYNGAFDTDFASAELYDPVSGTFADTGSMIGARSGHTATLLRDGRVLIAGGFLESGQFGNPGATAELYVPANPTPDCGNYATVDGFCRRIGIFPWYAAIPGRWETDLELKAGSSDTVRFGYSNATAPSFDGTHHNLFLESGTQTFISENVDHLNLASGDSYTARILGGVDCLPSHCQDQPPTAGVGSLVVTIDGPNAIALDSAYVRATHKLLGGDGVVAAEADAPVIFRDQASNRWSASVTETPLSQQTQAGSKVTSFAVTNLAEAPQAVIVKVFDASGNLVASAKTPVLNGASSLGPPFEEADTAGGVYAAALSGLLGVDLPSPGGSIFVPWLFHGTVVFEGEKGGKIAPLVVQMNGPSITSVAAKPE